MRRYVSRPFGNSMSMSRVLSLVVLLALLGMIYDRARQPQTWKWLEHEAAADEQAVLANAKPDGTPSAEAAPNETVVAGPNDTDEAQREELALRMRVITDKDELKAREMPAYWLLMAWSRSEPLADLRARAAPEPAFSELFETPAKFRGKPVRISLHVRRVLKYEAPENSQGIKDVYELWGWTDNSKSFPYVVVMPELPPGVPVGADVHAEVKFTGYFLKLMAYTAFDVRRAAPLMIGRAEYVERPNFQQPKEMTNNEMAIFGGIAIAVIVVLAITTWWRWRNMGRKQPYDERKIADDLPLWSESSESLPPFDVADDKVLR